MKRLILSGLGGALMLVLIPTLDAQVCSGNSNVVGPYAFAGSRLVFVGAPPATPGTGSTGGTTVPEATGQETMEQVQATSVTHLLEPY